MMCRAWWGVGLLCLALGTLPVPAAAQGVAKPKLKCDLRTATLRGRTGAPIPVIWTFEWNGNAVLEGEIHYTVVGSNRVLGSFVQPDVVISPGAQSFRGLIPALGTHEAYADLAVRVEYVTEKKRFNEFDEFAIRPPVDRQRNTVVAVCDAWDVGALPLTQLVEKKIALDAFEPPTDNASKKLLTSSTYRMTPRDFPTEPASLCGFDVLVVGAEGFADLREGQLQALADWVDAGGSLCLMPEKKLTDLHVKSLNLLGRTGGERPPYFASPTGALEGGVDQDVTLVRAGLGRVAIVRRVPQGLDGDYTDRPPQAWSEACGFLWKLRSDRRRVVVNGGTWGDLPEEQPQQTHNPYGYQYDNQYNQDYSQLGGRFVIKPVSSGNWLVTKLIPDTVKVVPLTLIGVILAVYVLVVGPLDYFGLGWLRLRKLTWLLFPISTLFFTACTVFLSNWYMYSRIQSRSAWFVDMGDDNKVTRVNRLELLFTNTRRRVETEVQRGLFSALNHRKFGASFDPNQNPYNANYNRYNNNPYGQVDESTESIVDPPHIVGRVPGRFTAVQEIPQWTPQLNRTLQIAPTGIDNPFDWNTLSYADFAGSSASDAGVQEAVRKLKTAFGPDISIYVFKEGRSFAAAESGLKFLEAVGSDSSSFLVDACQRPQLGYFQIVSQVSPIGGEEFEDLPMIDPSEAGERLLVVAVPRGNDYYVYRKLYTR